MDENAQILNEDENRQILVNIMRNTYFTINPSPSDDKLQTQISIGEENFYLEYIVRLINVFRQVIIDKSIIRTKGSTAKVPSLLVEFYNYAKEMKKVYNNIAELRGELAQLDDKDSGDIKKKLEAESGTLISLRDKLRAIDYSLRDSQTFYEQVQQIYPGNHLIADDVLDIPFVNEIAIDIYSFRSIGQDPAHRARMRSQGARLPEKLTAAKLYLSGYHDVTAGVSPGQRAPAFIPVLRIVPDKNQLKKLAEEDEKSATRASGGKSIKSRKPKKHRKSRKSRKPRKSRKSRKPRKSRKSRKPRKYRKSRKNRY